MATEDKVASEREKVEKLRADLAELNAAEASGATEDEITLKQLQREGEQLQAQIDAKKAAKEKQHELASDPIAYSQYLLELKNKQAAALTEAVVLDATGDKKAAKAAAAEATGEKKDGGN